jgi:hypothetical protein
VVVMMPHIDEAFSKPQEGQTDKAPQQQQVPVCVCVCVCLYFMLCVHLRVWSPILAGHTTTGIVAIIITLFPPAFQTSSSSGAGGARASSA